jgi:hypothetical protein
MVAEAIHDVQLTEREVQQDAGTLSGGQKRRLCLAMALIGDSPVVFLVRKKCEIRIILKTSLQGFPCRCPSFVERVSFALNVGNQTG